MTDWMKLAGIRSSEITPPEVFKNRRKLLQASVAAGLGGLIASPAVLHAEDLKGPISKSKYSTDEELSSLETVTTIITFMSWVLIRAIRPRTLIY